MIDRDGVGPPFLPFEVHYADTHGAQGLQVVWRGVDDAAFPTEVVPAHHLAVGTTARPSPFPHRTTPSAFCASQSTVSALPAPALRRVAARRSGSERSNTPSMFF